MLVRAMTAIPSAAVEAGARGMRDLMRDRAMNDVTAKHASTYWIDKAAELSAANLEAASERVPCFQHDGVPCSYCSGSGFMFILRHDHPRDRVTPGGPIDVNDIDPIWRNPQPPSNP